MLFHNLMNSDDQRIAKSIVKEQAKSGHDLCWYGNLRKESEQIGLVLHEELVVGKIKSRWKKEVKEKIGADVERKMGMEKTERRKMRFLQKRGVDTYLQKIHNEEARMGIKIRLNMVEWIDDNLGQESVCPLCREEKDTTEHVFACREGQNIHGVTVKNLEDGENMGKIVELFKGNEERRREELLNGIKLNIDRVG